MSLLPIMSLRTAPLTRPLALPRALPSPFLRSASTAPPPPRTPVEPTTFSDKSAPRQVHMRPELIRGMPGAPGGVLGAGPYGTVPRKKSEVPRRAEGGEESFSGPSRPRMMYERPGGRDLPKARSVIPFVLGLGLLGLGWGIFVLQATNAERLASSVTKQVSFQLRNSHEVVAMLGENVTLVDNWWSLNQPWISGTINLMQGRVDLSFRIKGDKAYATVYFTSIRPQEYGSWRIVRYKVIRDDGEVVRLEDKVVRTT
ncbi:hypothetical protein IAT38_005742 [Cryptococcus sp. DSM 104549]